MIYLVEALYSTLEKKQLPTLSSTNSEDDIDDQTAGAIGFTFLFLTGWCIFFLLKNRKYHWLSQIGMLTLLANPFYEVQQHGGGFGGGGFGGRGEEVAASVEAAASAAVLSEAAASVAVELRRGGD